MLQPMFPTRRLVVTGPSRPPSRVFLAAFAMFALAILGFGVWLFITAEQRIAHSRPVEATVVGTRVDAYRRTAASSRRAYTPMVDYEYAVDGRAYRSSEVYPLRQSGNPGWARDVVRRYAAGQRVTAHVDTNDPSQAFLIAEPPVAFYFFLAIPLALLLILGMIARAARGAAASGRLGTPGADPGAPGPFPGT